MKFSRTYTDLVEQFIPSGKRIAVNQGGTRSGKTYSIIQFLIETAIRAEIMGMPAQVITICRKTLPSLKATAMRDFIEILESIGMYSETYHNKSVNEYHLCGSIFEFISLDQPTKVRGRKRNILFINEANECSFEDWRQLLMRTTDKIIIDYNPSDEYHWIYDNVVPRSDAMFFQTTYKDNPHLQQAIIDEIERLQFEDENYWNIYGLGERGISGATIFSGWEFIDAMPDAYEQEAYGIDFGYNNPTALVCARIKDKVLYGKQIIYQSHLTNTDLISLMRTHEINKRTKIYCDNAEPDRIEELRRAGYNAVPAKKDVKIGIDKLKSVRVCITKDSTDMNKEYRSYKWKIDKSEKPTDEPVKVNDHAIDAFRYAAFDMVQDRKITARVGKVI